LAGLRQRETELVVGKGGGGRLTDAIRVVEGKRTWKAWGTKRQKINKKKKTATA